MNKARGRSLPQGSVTFLLTDLEGSTRLWEEDRDAMSGAVRRHDALIAGSIEAHGGHQPKGRGEGDSVLAVFSIEADVARAASEAAACAIELQRLLSIENWSTPRPLKMRIALNTGTADLRAGDYYGPVLNRCARLRALAHGGQILLSAVTAELIREHLPKGAWLRDLGLHRLKGVETPERVFQLGHADIAQEFPPLQSPTTSFLLPSQLTSFVGREADLVEVDELIGNSRLVTLTGGAGCGKTRLALEAATAVSGRFIDGVRFVELASLSDPELLPQTVAWEFGVRETERPLREVMDDHLASLDVLLILDNCEHLVEACAEFVVGLLKTGPGLRVLATSREPLRVSGESVKLVEPLPTPDTGAAALGELLDNPSVRLFLDRVRASNPDLVPTEGSATAAAAISRRLEGIPLALELAAAWATTLTMEEIDDRLSRSLDLLAARDRSKPARHRTIDAAVGWSYELLTDDERRLLRRLSVFQGGFSLDAVTELMPSDALGSDDSVGRSVLDLLASLIDKSLVFRSSPADRYHMHGAVRYFAHRMLAGSEEEVDMRAGHLGWALGMAEQAESGLSGEIGTYWMDRLDLESDNLRGALTWSLEHHPEAALRLATYLGGFWSVRGYWSEGRRWLDEALEAAPQTAPDLRAEALLAAGTLANSLGDHAPARGLFERALGIAEQGDSQQLVAESLSSLGRLDFQMGDLASAARRYRQSMELARSLDDDARVARSLTHLGAVAMKEGDHSGARSLYEEALVTARRSGDSRAIASCHYVLGELGILTGDYDWARERLEEGLGIARELGDRKGIAGSLHDLGELAALTGATAEAERLLREGLEISRDLGDKRLTAHFLLRLADLVSASGDLDAAETMIREAFGIRTHLADRGGVAACLAELGTVAVGHGRLEAAAAMFAAAGRLREGVAGTAPRSQASHEKAIEQIRAALDPAVFDAAWKRGLETDPASLVSTGAGS